MPRTNKIGGLSHQAKAAREERMKSAQKKRWSNKENIPPNPRASPSKPESTNSLSQSKISQLTSKLKVVQQSLRRAKAKVQKETNRAKTAIAREKEAIKNCTLTIQSLRNQNDNLMSSAEAMRIQLESLLLNRKVKQKEIHRLKERIRRFSGRLATAVKKGRESLTLRLRYRGVYTAQARRLMQDLVHVGCASRKVGHIIQKIGRSFGFRIIGKPSERTVQRVQLEGLVASDIQAAYEIGAAKALTISQDSTSNRHVNFESHHYALQVPNYAEGETRPSDSSKHKVRLLRVASTLDHTSEKSCAAWLDQLKDVHKTYENSPLAQRSNTPKFSIRHFALILKGMNGDHASAEKSTSNLIQEWKKEETLLSLGEEELLTRQIADLLAYLHQKRVEFIERLGGNSVWDALEPTKRSEFEETLMREIKLDVGKEVYETLPDYDRRMLDLFVWAGCCMHKDQNSFKGGNTAMMGYWEKNNVPGPIPLANKFNAQKIRDMLDPSRKNTPLTSEEATALENTTRGGAKVAALAGALFNNKDDKKGYGDTYQMFREAEDLVEKVCARFPDTSNTRFNSHADAAAELLVHLRFYVRFLEHVRDAKKVPGWTNIEVNIHKALLDVPTLTELAAMVLYSHAITHPYMREVRGHGTEMTNVLDLGPLHIRVRAHCQKIINNPDLLVSEIATYEVATLDSLSWERPEAIVAVQKLLPELPHLRGVVIAFFEGALATWIRFSSEFAPGGVIDCANAEEKKLAWMPSTNDTNEGALGAYRVYMRNKPSTTLLQYNAYAVWERNDTQAFVDALFTKEDEVYVRQKAREWDRQGKERERKRALREFGEKQVEIRREKEVQKRLKAEDRRTRLLKVIISPQTFNLSSLTVVQLDEQLDALREIYCDKDIPNKSARGKKADKVALLKDAIGRFDNNRLSLQHTVEESLTRTVLSWDEEDEMEMEMEVDEQD